MMFEKVVVAFRTPARSKKVVRPRNRRCSRPVIEDLESRIALSVGGGWISVAQPGRSGEGIFGQYYSNANLAGTPSFTRWEDRVDFLWTQGNANPGGSSNAGFSSVGPDNWSAEWSGTLTANFTETYTFQINSAAAGVRLWVTPVGQNQSAPIINDWTNHGQTTDTGTISLTAGADDNVTLELLETTAATQQVQLQWSSPSTPLEDIESATSVGLNIEGNDALFANMVNGGTQATWTPPRTSGTVPTDSNDWPETNAMICLGQSDPTVVDGGSYLVQFTGMASVYNNLASGIDWWVGGTNLNSSTLEAGQGYNPATNTTTATMVVPAWGASLFYLSFTNTSRDPVPGMIGISGITESSTGTTVTVSVPSVAGLAAKSNVTIAGFTGSAAMYNGTFVIQSVNTSNNTFTYTATTTGLPGNPTGGTMLANPANDGITNLYVMQPSVPGGNTPLPVGTLFTPAALAMASQYSALRMMGPEDTNDNLTSNWSDRTLVSDNFWSGWTFNSDSGVDSGVAMVWPVPAFRGKFRWHWRMKRARMCTLTSRPMRRPAI